MLRFITLIFARILRLDPHFTLLFFKREGKELLGRRQRNYWILSGIIFLTFLAVGFSAGSLVYLDYKMNDPFIKWVTIPLQRTQVKDIVPILNDSLSKDEVKKKYDYKAISGYVTNAFWFRDKSGESRPFWGRQVPHDDDILQKIVEEKNLVRGHAFPEEHSVGIIVTERLLHELGLNRNTAYLHNLFQEEDEPERYVPVPITAVVKELPNRLDYVITPYFMFIRYYSSEFLCSPSRYTNKLRIWIRGDSATARRFDEEVNGLFTKDPHFSGMTAYPIPPKKDTETRLGYVMKISFSPEPDSVEQIEALYEVIRKSLPDFETELLYLQRDIDGYELPLHHALSVQFNTIDKIREFKDYMAKAYEIDIDMAQIDMKENYRYVSRLTQFISFVLLFFSALSITFFMSSLLRNHFESIKMNIGTFKAFGMETGTLKKIYLMISTTVVTAAIALAWVLAWITGESGVIRSGLGLFFKRLESGQKYFALFNELTLLTILVILASSLVVMSRITRRLFSRLPGDLIYDRNKE